MVVWGNAFAHTTTVVLPTYGSTTTGTYVVLPLVWVNAFAHTTVVVVVEEEFPYVSGAGACVILSTLDKSTVGHGTGRNQKFQCTISPDFR